MAHLKTSLPKFQMYFTTQTCDVCQEVIFAGKWYREVEGDHDKYTVHNKESCIYVAETWCKSQGRKGEYDDC